MPGDRGSQTSSYPTPLGGGVVIALDGDTPATGPLRFAFEQADARGDELHVLHAIPPGTTKPDAEAIRANIGAVLAGWSDSYPEVRVLLSFPVDEADDACARATDALGARRDRPSTPSQLAAPTGAALGSRGTQARPLPRGSRTGGLPGSLTWHPSRLVERWSSPPQAGMADLRDRRSLAATLEAICPEDGRSSGRTSATCERSMAPTRWSSVARSTSVIGCGRRRSPDVREGRAAVRPLALQYGSGIRRRERERAGHLGGRDGRVPGRRSSTGCWWPSRPLT